MKIVIIILIVVLMIIAGCSKTYVCYDGTQQKDARKCPIVPYPQIDKRAAEQAADKFGNAYAVAKGDRFTRVNVYWEGNDWYADILLTSVDTEEVNQAKLSINGSTSTVSCVSGCDYLGLE